jgi:Leucine-rich repeat (LRR) protein
MNFFKLTKRSLTGILLLLAFAALAHFPFQYEEVFFEKSKRFLQPFATKGSYLSDHDPYQLAAPWHAAGWPIRYYVQADVEGQSPVIAFSIWRFLANLSVWLAAFASIFVYHQLAAKKEAKIKPKITTISIGDLMAATSLIAFVFWYGTYLTRNGSRDRALFKEIEAVGGMCEVSLALPTPLKPIIPSPFYPMIARLVAVNVPEPDSSLVERLVNSPYLQQLFLGGGDYDLRLLDQLPTKPFLREVRLSGRKLDVGTIASLASCAQLTHLNIMNTDVNEKALPILEGMTRLRSLNLIRTEVDTSQASFGRLATQLDTLYLPHPSRSNSRISLEDWPELQVLICDEPDEPSNPYITTVQIKNMPNLARIELDGIHTFDLMVENAPELSEIRPLIWRDAEKRIPRNRSLPQLPLLRSVELRSVPKLQKIETEEKYFRSARIRSPDQVSLFIGSSETNDSRFFFSNRADISETTADPRRQAWINSMAECDGIRDLRLSRVPLSGVDFTPLTKMSALVSLELSKTFLQQRQWKQLLSIKQLESMDLAGNPVDGQIIAEVVNNLPNLRNLYIDPWTVGRLRLEDNAKIKSLFTKLRNTPMPLPTTLVDAMRLKNLPELAETLDFSEKLSYLHLENIPSIRGISTRSPWLEKATMRGIRDLEYFVGGGKHFGDEEFRELLSCKSLARLTIAHSHVSRELLEQIVTLTSLTRVNLTGCKVDDSLINAWHTLPNLVELHLESTFITDASVSKLLECKELEVLAIGNSGITAKNLQRLSVLPKIRSLRLSDSKIDKETAIAINGFKKLLRLDLSGCQIDREALMEFATNAPPRLTFLKLRGSTPDGLGLQSLSAERSTLSMDAVDAVLDPKTLDVLRRGYRNLLEESPPDYDNELAIFLQVSATQYLQSRFDIPEMLDVESVVFKDQAELMNNE